MQSHRVISSQTIIETNTVQKAELLQKKFHEMWNSAQFLKKLENTFSSLVSEKDWVVIDRLDLDVDEVRLNMSDDQLQNLIIEKLGKSLKSKLDKNRETKAEYSANETEPKKNTKDAYSINVIDNYKKLWVQAANKHVKPSAFVSTYSSLQELFEQTKSQFLKHGQSFSSWAQPFIRDHKEACANNLPIEIVIQFIAEVLPKAKSKLTSLQKSVRAWAQKNPTEVKELFLFVKLKLLGAVSGSTDSEQFEIELKAIETVLKQLRKDKVLLKEILEKQTHSIESLKTEVAPPAAETKNSQPTEKAIYIDNAGMAILFPYLRMAFENLGYSDKEVLEKPSRAIHFLSFLEKGEELFAPHRTALYKIVCGQNQNFWVDPDIVLSNFEKEEAESLLKAVIEHWGALKNTSPNGLRDAFLQRNGKLEMKDFDFNLKVESQAQDILLSSIPWGFGTLKLPWMTNFLHVDW